MTNAAFENEAINAPPASPVAITDGTTTANGMFVYRTPADGSTGFWDISDNYAGASTLPYFRIYGATPANANTVEAALLIAKNDAAYGALLQAQASQASKNSDYQSAETFFRLDFTSLLGSGVGGTTLEGDGFISDFDGPVSVNGTGLLKNMGAVFGDVVPESNSARNFVVYDAIIGIANKGIYSNAVYDPNIPADIKQLNKLATQKGVASYEAEQILTILHEILHPFTNEATYRDNTFTGHEAVFDRCVNSNNPTDSVVITVNDVLNDSIE